MKDYESIDLCECYEPLDYPSKEILREWKLGSKPKREPNYGTRIKVSEHFAKDGKPLENLLEDVIKYSVKSSL